MNSWAKKAEEKDAQRVERKRKREEEMERKREEKFNSSAKGIMQQLQNVPVDNIADWLNSDNCIVFKKSFKTFLTRRKKRRKVKLPLVTENNVN